MEGIIEGVHNGNVTADTLADVRKRLYRMLRKAKDSAERRVWTCDYNTAVFDEYAKPEEMVTSWIVRNGSRPGYERLQTTHPDVVESHQHEAAATVPAWDTPAAVGIKRGSDSFGLGPFPVGSYRSSRGREGLCPNQGS